MTPDMLDSARKLLKAGDDKPAKVAKLLQVGRSTFYRHFPASERETVDSPLQVRAGKAASRAKSR